MRHADGRGIWDWSYGSNHRGTEIVFVSRRLFAFGSRKSPSRFDHGVAYNEPVARSTNKLQETMASSTATFMPTQGTAGTIYVDTQHEDLVHDAQLDYYGCKLATASSGESILTVGRPFHLNTEELPFLA